MSLHSRSAKRRHRSYLSGASCLATVLIALAAHAPVEGVWAAATAVGPGNEVRGPGRTYEYNHGGKPVVLHASPRFIAVREGAAFAPEEQQRNQLERDPRSDRRILKSARLALYRQRPPKGKKDRPPDLRDSIETLAKTATGMVQPVFEQGMALLIPSDEVIVGFADATTLQEAVSFLAPWRGRLGVTDVRDHRRNSFILTLRNPSNGRCYEVCRSLAQLGRIAFAEPNHIVIALDQDNDRYQIGPVAEQAILGPDFGGGEAPAASQEGDGATTGPVLGRPGASPSWTTIASIDCESATFPPTSWQLGTFGGPSAYWGRTSYREHGGSYSIYCAASGSAGVSPPGPAPLNMQAVLRSPVYDLTGYEEVYVELWFYAKNDLYPGPGGTLYDYPSVYVFESGVGGVGRYLATYASGDCTTDPTTDSGWRRFLFRVPESYRVSNAYFDFRYNSDGVDQFEGAYLDDIRIIGTTNVDTEPLGNDTFGARHWDLLNAGQVAGLGNDNNDLHATDSEAWGLVSVSSDVVVAVIDSGVDLTHPDMNLVAGYDYNGASGGGPRGDHGTACAGEVGAIRGNAIGVIGLAPNCKIMPIYYGTQYADMASAIDVAVAHGADILSNSWGWVGAPSTSITNAINDALTAGAVVLFAAGNGPDRSPWTYDVAYPGSLTGSTDVICVGASSPTDEHKSASSSDGQHSWGSSYVGDGPDIVTPGCWSYTTDRQGEDGYNDGTTDLSDADYTHDFGGTSSSTPKAAGVVALLLSANPNLTPGQVKAFLRNTADDIDAVGVDDKTGAGRVNAYRMLQSLSVVDTHSSPQNDLDLPDWNDTEPEKMSVLKFKLTDHGEDSLPTLIDQVVVSLDGTAGYAGSDVAWAELRDATVRIATAASITDSQIVFGSTPNSDSTPQLDTVPDNSSVEYSVYIYLNTSLQGAHDATYVFDVDETGIGADGGDSSQMAGDSGAVTAVTGTLFITALGISVTPEQWIIGPQPLGYVGESGPFSVENTGNVAEDISIKGSDGSNGWNLEGAVGVNAFKVEADQGDDGSYETVVTTEEQAFAMGVPVLSTETLGLRYSGPSGDTMGGGIAQDFILTLKVSMHVP